MRDTTTRQPLGAAAKVLTVQAITLALLYVLQQAFSR
jgi:hypothetical protein